MPTLYLRFYEELNDYLPENLRKVRFSHKAPSDATVGTIIGALGIPFGEVDLVLSGDTPVDFSHRVREGETLSIYPMFETLDIGSVTPLPGRPLRQPRFVLDTHLGKLAHYLRLMGFDSDYSNQFSDDELVHKMSAERRILLTRDRALLNRKAVTHGFFVPTDHPRQQTVAVLRRFDLLKICRPFTRCLKCNRVLNKIEKDKIGNRVGRETWNTYREFRQCPDCRRIYWKGSHHQRMQRMVDEILSEAGSHPHER